MARTDDADSVNAGDGDEGARILRALRAALIGRSDLPYRLRPADAEREALTGEQRRSFYELGLQHAESVLEEVSDQVEALGQLRYKPAVPTLLELWEHDPGPWDVGNVGAALLAIGTPQARAAVRARIDDEDRSVRTRTIAALLTGESGAWDTMSWLFTPERLATSIGVGVAWEVLAQFGDSGQGTEYDFVAADRRWLDLCVSLRHHPVLAEVARDALRHADPAVTRPVLDEVAAAARAERDRRAPALVSGSLLRRYQRGEHQAVWRELAAAGPLTDAWRAEAGQVAAATMERVRDNAERLAKALRERGWPLPWGSLAGPDPDTDENIREMERELGAPVPPALAAFWRVVGSIDFVPGQGSSPWPDRAEPAGVPEGLGDLDPLEIRGGVCLRRELDSRRGDNKAVHPAAAQPQPVHPEAAFMDFGICRDSALKQGYSGATIPVFLPFAGADPVVEDGAGLSLTDYLRKAFAGQGFLEDYRDLDATGRERDEMRSWLDSVDFEPLGF
ncbi:MAG TPA: HEAT repeat domain-containing protein [Trebonia sp.]